MVLCILARNFDRLIFWELAPWNLENILKSTNNLSFLCQFFINEITASDAGPDIIRSHLFWKEYECTVDCHDEFILLLYKYILYNSVMSLFDAWILLIWFFDVRGLCRWTAKKSISRNERLYKLSDLYPGTCITVIEWHSHSHI